MKVCLTGGIASGKSLLCRYLNELGVKTIDADDIVHSLIPDEERARLRKIVFNNPEERKKLEARIHPIVRKTLLEAVGGGTPPTIAVVPLLFEVQWEKDYAEDP